MQYRIINNGVWIYYLYSMINDILWLKTIFLSIVTSRMKNWHSYNTFYLKNNSINEVYEGTKRKYKAISEIKSFNKWRYAYILNLPDLVEEKYFTTW